MLTEQRSWAPKRGWRSPAAAGSPAHPQVVFLFGSSEAMAEGSQIAEVGDVYPGALLFGCSTAGEIGGTEVSDGSLVATAVQFEHTHIQSTTVNLDEVESSYEAGRSLARRLPTEGLVHVLVLSDGLRVNGSALVEGMTDALPPGVTATGGLAGDGTSMRETYVCLDGVVRTGVAGAIGFYGSRLSVGYGSMGGWDPFGPERIITRSEGNVLYELDDRSALSLYKQYLGPHAADLPASGLLFPLSIRTDDETNGLVRTILAVDDERESLTFAGDVPQGRYARFMKANFDRLVDGAAGAAKASHEAIGSAPPDPGDPYQLRRSQAGAQAAHRRGGRERAGSARRADHAHRVLFLWRDRAIQPIGPVRAP